jgi:hypothetical protein
METIIKEQELLQQNQLLQLLKEAYIHGEKSPSISEKELINVIKKIISSVASAS